MITCFLSRLVFSNALFLIIILTMCVFWVCVLPFPQQKDSVFRAGFLVPAVVPYRAWMRALD